MRYAVNDGLVANFCTVLPQRFFSRDSIGL